MLNPRQRLMKLWRRMSLRHVRQVQKRRPNTCGSKRQPEGREPRRHPKNSVSRSTPTTNEPLCSTDFLLRVTRAGPCYESATSVRDKARFFFVKKKPSVAE